MTKKYNCNTEEARRACHDKLANARLKPGQNPDDFYIVLKECPLLLADMGQTFHDERYEKMIVQALPAEYERLRLTSYWKRDFGLNNNRHMMHTIYIDSLSRPSKPKPIEVHDITMQVSGYNGNNVQCTF